MSTRPSQPNAKRSLNPLTGLIAVGKQADFICEHRSSYGYGPTSPWARLTDLDAYCLILGASFEATTFNHHVEATVGVPHLYNKIYRTPAFVHGKPYACPIVTAVRYLNYGVETSMSRLEAKLDDMNLIRRYRRGALDVLLFKLRDCENVLTDCLSRDPYFLLKEPPRFVAGVPPDDGATGSPPNIFTGMNAATLEFIARQI